MLRIECEVKQSSIPNTGMGIFTKQKILKGQVVWSKSIFDIAILKEEYEKLKDLGLHEYIRKYATLEKDNNWFLDVDEMKFCQHSPNPNILLLDYVGVATKEIESQNELFVDYFKITHPEHAKFLLNGK